MEESVFSSPKIEVIPDPAEYRQTGLASRTLNQGVPENTMLKRVSANAITGSYGWLISASNAPAPYTLLRASRMMAGWSAMARFFAASNQ